MATVKSETIYNPAFPQTKGGHKHVFKYDFDAADGTFTAGLPDWMAAALGKRKTEPKKTLDECERALREAIRDFAQVQSVTDLVIACRYITSERHENKGIRIEVRAALFKRKITTNRTGSVTEYKEFDFRDNDDGTFDEPRWKSWRCLDMGAFWNSGSDLEVIILPHTPELEAFFLRLAAGLTAFQEQLGAMLENAETITLTMAKAQLPAFALPTPAPPAALPASTVDRCLCGSTRYVFWLPTGSRETWSDPQDAPPMAGETDPRCAACNKPWNSDPPKSAEVFTRTECVFHYCPDPAACAQACKHPAAAIAPKAPPPRPYDYKLAPEPPNQPATNA